ncbi:hypothetical protein [Streptomyces sp. NPDC013740]|uniref:hypothetical protein n=1 Tax=Streptomyces sp. NPDC013740 TaxID=3364867 RepID=UPI0036F5884E
MHDHEKARTAPAAAARTSADRRRPSGPGTPREGLLSLQATAGNAAVVQLLREGGHSGAQERHQHGAGCGHGQAEGAQSRTAVQRAPEASTGVAVQRAPSGGHAQGEHIFNALDDLAKKCGTVLADRVDRRLTMLSVNKTALSHGQNMSLWNSTAQRELLREAADKASALRDNRDYRSATRGEPMNAQGQDPNSIRYSAFSDQVRAALATCGTPQWNDGAALVALKADLIRNITDQVARAVKRDTDLPENRRRGFDDWYRATETQMDTLFAHIIGTGRAVHAALMSTVHAAFGFEEGDEIGDEIYTM